METLKLKFKLHTLEFEIEGKESTVKEEFKDFKSFAQELLSKNNIITSIENTQRPKTNNQLTDIEDISIDDYPLLKDVIMLDYPKSEPEWILVYAFYESNFGQEIFTRDSLLEKYRETKRYTENRSKKFSENFKSLLLKKFFKSKNETEYLLLENGKQTAIEIISGNSESKSSKPKVQKRKIKSNERSESATSNKSTTKKSTEFKIVSDLNLKPEGKISLQDYSTQFVIESSEELYLVIIHYLRTILDLENVGLSHIYTCLIELDKKLPTHLRQIFINMKNSSNHWLQLDDLNNLNFSIRGMNHIKFDIKKAN